MARHAHRLNAYAPSLKGLPGKAQGSDVTVQVVQPLMSSSTRLLTQAVAQCLCLDKVASIEALGEPAVDGGKEVRLAGNVGNHNGGELAVHLPSGWTRSFVRAFYPNTCHC